MSFLLEEVEFKGDIVNIKLRRKHPKLHVFQLHVGRILNSTFREFYDILKNRTN